MDTPCMVHAKGPCEAISWKVRLDNEQAIGKANAVNLCDKENMSMHRL